jgi:hypothetical protein
MKKINAWLNKFFRIGMGEDVQVYKVVNGIAKDYPKGKYSHQYGSKIHESSLRDGASIIVDHKNKMITFK